MQNAKQVIKKEPMKMMLLVLMLLMTGQVFSQSSYTYPIVDTKQVICYDTLQAISAPVTGEPFFGQDAQYAGYQPQYQDNGNGTVTDLVTGLMWQQNLLDEKLSFDEAVAGAATFNLAGYNDWRLPTIKELYSLIMFDGTDPSGPDPGNPVPFINTDVFEFEYGDTLAGERLIDAQYWSSTEYVGTTMNGDATTFGVNFADGRIKGYPSEPVGPPGQQFNMTAFVKYVRGGNNYGVNDFTDNNDGTVTDSATGLMWCKDDSGEGLNWQDALAFVQQKNLENHLSHSDWRLPNAKEMQSILDYSRSPQTSNSAAIDPVFNISEIIDESGELNYPFFWTGTTHASSNGSAGFGVYVCFGEALGFMEMPPGSGNYYLVDVHGAGAQRSDPKSGNPDSFPFGHGPQGDVVRIFNYVRMVRDAESSTGYDERNQDKNMLDVYPNPCENQLSVAVGNIQSGFFELLVFNASGHLVFSRDLLSDNVLQIDIGNWSTGIYAVVLRNSASSYTRKFIKN